MKSIKHLLIAIGILALASCAKPLSNFTINTEDTKAPSDITFLNNSENAESYLWDFGDGNTSTEATPEHRYVLSGKYTVKLTAKKGNKENTSMKDIILDPPQDCLVLIETSMGNMTVRLYDDTPQHRDNFIKLAESDFYSGLIFHRVIEGFMIQGGDPNSKNAKPGQNLGSGGPGYTVPEEINENYAHVKGALSAARQGDAVNPKKNSSGSQFYIVQGRPVTEDVLDNMELRKGIKYSQETRNTYKELGGTPFLDMEYTVFGIVEEGMDIIDKIAASPTNPGDRPKEDIKILNVKVVK